MQGGRVEIPYKNTIKSKSGNRDIGKVRVRNNKMKAKLIRRKACHDVVCNWYKWHINLTFSFSTKRETLPRAAAGHTHFGRCRSGSVQGGERVLALTRSAPAFLTASWCRMYSLAWEGCLAHTYTRHLLGHCSCCHSAQPMFHLYLGFLSSCRELQVQSWMPNAFHRLRYLWEVWRVTAWRPFSAVPFHCCFSVLRWQGMSMEFSCIKYLE